MEIKPNLSCLSIILKDKRSTSIWFNDNYYLKSNELTSEEIISAILSSSTTPLFNENPDILLSFSYYGKTINVSWDGVNVNVSGNAELNKEIEACLINIGKGLVLSYDPNIIPIDSSLLQGSMDYKRGLSIHDNPYRNKEQIKNDDWIYGWELAKSFNPGSILKIN